MLSLQQQPDEKTAVTSPSLLSAFINKPRSLSLRKFLFDLHFFFGIGIGLYLMMMSITGVSLVFREEIESAVVAQPLLIARGERKPFSTLIEHVEKTYSGFRVTGIINVKNDGSPIKIFASGPDGRKLKLLVDPYAVRILGDVKVNPLIQFLQDLHFDLLNGRTGRIINCFGGAFLCIMSVSGIFLWWRGLRTWSRSLVIQTPSPNHKKLNWDLHNMVGFWTLPILLSWGVSGMYFAFRPEVEKIIDHVLPISSLSYQIPEAESASSLLSIDTLVQEAVSRVPGQWVARIIPASEKEPVCKVWMTKIESYNKDDNTEIDLDARSGEILAESFPESRKAGDVFVYWFNRLHFGSFAGWLSKSIWIFLGLAPTVLGITGAIMWWNRELRRRVSSKRDLK